MTDNCFYTRYGPVSLKDILNRIGLSDNADNAMYKGISASDAVPLKACKSGAISFYRGRKHISDLKAASGGICFVSSGDQAAVEDAGLIPVVSKYARADFARAIDLLYSKNDFKAGQPSISENALIADSAQILTGAVIGDGVKIGENVTVGPNVVIYPGVTIGAGSYIEANSTLQCATLGKNCKIHSGASIGGDGFGIAPSAAGLVEIPHIGLVVLEDNVSIGYGSTIDRGMLGNTLIKQGAKIDNLCQVGHNCTIGENTMVAGHCGLSGSVILGDNVLLGGQVGIADHVVIGDGAMIAGGSHLMKDIPAGAKWGGSPAKPMRLYMREVAALKRIVENSRGSSKG